MNRPSSHPTRLIRERVRTSPPDLRDSAPPRHSQLDGDRPGDEGGWGCQSELGISRPQKRRK
jgi:hypothetical protein